MRLQLGLTPGQAIERLGANDPSLTICDLGNNAVLQIRSAELIPQLSAALAQNSHCKELNLSNSNLDDSTCEALGKALGKNNTLTLLNLEGNRITLLKIVWRLESRQSFRLTKMITRNNEIRRRINSGRDYAEMLPVSVQSIAAQ